MGGQGFAGLEWGMPDLDHWPLARLLSTTARLAEHAWAERLTGLNLTPAGVTALEILAESGPAAQAAVAVRARVQPQTMGKTLSKLEASGYVVRQRGQGDARVQRVHISERGRAALIGARTLQRALHGNDGVIPGNLDAMLSTVIRQLAEMP